MIYTSHFLWSCVSPACGIFWLYLFLAKVLLPDSMVALHSELWHTSLSLGAIVMNSELVSPDNGGHFTAGWQKGAEK